MNWRLVAIPVSIIPFLVIAIQFDVSLEDVFAVGFVPFAAAAIAMSAKLFMQGLKFTYLVRKFFGPVASVRKTVMVRIGSEFVTFTTPMFVGGEVVRIVWLRKQGIKTGKASWITIVEIVTEVIAAGTISIIAAVFALVSGAIVVGIAILAISLPVITIWSVLFFLSSKRTFQVPKALSALVKRLGKERAQKYVDKTNEWMQEICEMSRENFHNKEAKKAFGVSLFLSFIYWGFYGTTFFLIANGAGYFIELLDSVLAVMASNAIGNLPITIGGSGLTELGIWAYLGNLKDLTFDLSEGSVEWNIVIAWRIATYHVPLAISWILLMKLALGKYTKAEIS
ncbi:MAG: YbhN family protein, partial [Nitrosopumilaceae archaeon]